MSNNTLVRHNKVLSQDNLLSQNNKILSQNHDLVIKKKHSVKITT